MAFVSLAAGRTKHSKACSGQARGWVLLQFGRNGDQERAGDQQCGCGSRGNRGTFRLLDGGCDRANLRELFPLVIIKVRMDERDDAEKEEDNAKNQNETFHRAECITDGLLDDAKIEPLVGPSEHAASRGWNIYDYDVEGRGVRDKLSGNVPSVRVSPRFPKGIEWLTRPSLCSVVQGCSQFFQSTTYIARR